jgi:hypothetical protein
VLVNAQKEAQAAEANKPPDPNEKSVTICRESTPDEFADALLKWNWGMSGVKLRLDIVFAYDVVTALPAIFSAMWEAEANKADTHPEYKPPRGFANFPVIGYLLNAIYHHKNGRPLHATVETAMFLFDLLSAVEGGIALGKFIASSLASPLARVVGKEMAEALSRQATHFLEAEKQAMLRGGAGTVIRADAKEAACVATGTRMKASHFPRVGPTDKFAQYAGRIPRREGYFDLYIHSMNRGSVLAQIGTDGAREVADMTVVRKALKDAGWDGKQPIRLISCSAGDPMLKKRSAAFKLAEELGVKVLAPTEDITLFSDGRFVITNLPEEDVFPWTLNTGRWAEFGK